MAPVIVAIHQPQYLPYLGFFHKVAQADLLIVLDDVQFLERGHQHRNEIKMQTGKQWLTVPVVQRRGQLIREVRIDETQRWRRKHWAALETNYRPALYFAALAPRLRKTLLEGKQSMLLDLDLDLLDWAMSELGIAVPKTLSSAVGVEGKSTERLVNLCKAVGARTYLSGAGGRRYMDLEQFARAGIEVRFQEFTAKPYPQLFNQHGFIPNLAIVDALFNCGPRARALIAG